MKSQWWWNNEKGFGVSLGLSLATHDSNLKSMRAMTWIGYSRRRSLYVSSLNRNVLLEPPMAHLHSD